MICQNNPSNPRMSPEQCEARIRKRDRVCMAKTDGRFRCAFVRERKERMERITRWLVKKYMPGHVLVALSPEAVKAMIEERLKGFHLHANRRKKEEINNGTQDSTSR